MDEAPLLSIICITYNHKNFIAQAIDGFLKQITKFDLEIIIHDDCSTDGTIEIINDFAKKYPEIIKPIFQNINQYSLGLRIIPIVLPLCKGKYVAICEGDDYWTDPLKLQKQVDFLDKNPDYSICFHRVYNQIGKERVLSGLNESDKEETFTIEDLAKRNFIHTPSVVFRNNLINKFPQWFDGAAAGDYVLHMLNAQYGRIKYLPQPMAVYRLHGGGTWSNKTIGETHPKWIKLLNNLLRERFSMEVVKHLTLQKKEKIREYMFWLLDQNEHDLLKEVICKYYNQSGVLDGDWLIDSFLQYISLSKNRLRGLEASKSYKLAQTLSKIKNHILRF